MLEILEIKQKFVIDDLIFNQIISVYNNIRTKISIIEGCCEYFDPSNGFHCTAQMKKQQPVVNLISLVSCAKAIVDDLAEIIRLIFHEEFGAKVTPWRLSYRSISKNFPACPLVNLAEKYGFHESENTNTFYIKVKNLRDTLLHRNLENTYLSGSASFSIRSSYSHTNNELCAYEYAKNVRELLMSILNDMNSCLLTYGRGSIKGI